MASRGGVLVPIVRSRTVPLVDPCLLLVQLLGSHMKNLLMIAKFTKPGFTYSMWRAAFDADAQAQSVFWRGTIVGQVDDMTAMISTEVIDPVAMTAFLQANGPRFAELGVEHEVYTLTPKA